MFTRSLTWLGLRRMKAAFTWCPKGWRWPTSGLLATWQVKSSWGGEEESISTFRNLWRSAWIWPASTDRILPFDLYLCPIQSFDKVFYHSLEEGVDPFIPLLGKLPVHSYFDSFTANRVIYRVESYQFEVLQGPVEGHSRAEVVHCWVLISEFARIVRRYWYWNSQP